MTPWGDLDGGRTQTTVLQAFHTMRVVNALTFVMETSGNASWPLIFAFMLDDMSEFYVHAFRSNCADWGEGCERDRLFIVGVNRHTI